jgi:hypothetical protein
MVETVVAISEGWSLSVVGMVQHNARIAFRQELGKVAAAFRLCEFVVQYTCCTAVSIEY